MKANRKVQILAAALLVLQCGRVEGLDKLAEYGARFVAIWTLTPDSVKDYLDKDCERFSLFCSLKRAAPAFLAIAIRNGQRINTKWFDIYKLTYGLSRSEIIKLGQSKTLAEYNKEMDERLRKQEAINYASPIKWGTLSFEWPALSIRSKSINLPYISPSQLWHRFRLFVGHDGEKPTRAGTGHGSHLYHKDDYPGAQRNGFDLPYIQGIGCSPEASRGKFTIPAIEIFCALYTIHTSHVHAKLEEERLGKIKKERMRQHAAEEAKKLAATPRNAPADMPLLTMKHKARRHSLTSADAWSPLLGGTPNVATEAHQPAPFFKFKQKNENNAATPLESPTRSANSNGRTLSFADQKPGLRIDTNNVPSTPRAAESGSKLAAAAHPSS